MTTRKDVEREPTVYLCRASGEGSHNFRVCADESGVMAFYEEMFGRDLDGTLDSAVEHFREADNWGNDGTAYSCELYCATFEVWKVDPTELAAPADRGAEQYADAVRVAQAVISTLQITDRHPSRFRMEDTELLAHAVLSLTTKPAGAQAGQTDEKIYTKEDAERMCELAIAGYKRAKELSDAKRPHRCGQCRKCLEGQTTDFGGWIVPVASTRLVLCETCGCKRCPHATDCALACTGSNEPGQPGSVYGSPPDSPRGGK